MAKTKQKPPAKTRLTRREATGPILFDPLEGRWLTSYSGWIHVDPKPGPNAPPQPPQIAGYDYFPDQKIADTGTYAQREGYFVYAALIYLKLDGHRGLTGESFANRGGKDYVEVQLTGKYNYIWNAGFNAYEGVISTSQPGGQAAIIMNYKYIMKSRDELEWVWKDGSYRGIVARGTMTRVI